MDDIQYLSESINKQRTNDASTGLPAPDQMRLPLTVKIGLDLSQEG